MATAFDHIYCSNLTYGQRLYEGMDVFCGNNWRLDPEKKLYGEPYKPWEN